MVHKHACMKKPHPDASPSFTVSTVIIGFKNQNKIFPVLFLFGIHIGVFIIFILKPAVVTTSWYSCNLTKISYWKKIAFIWTGGFYKFISNSYLISLDFFKRYLLFKEVILFKKSFSCLRTLIFWLAISSNSSAVLSLVEGLPVPSSLLSLNPSIRTLWALQRWVNAVILDWPRISVSKPAFLNIVVGGTPLSYSAMKYSLNETS